MSDFHTQARVAARKDRRYAAVLEQVRTFAWPAGNPMVPGGWADALATDVLAAIRRDEGLEQPITSHTYEGDGGDCTAHVYSVDPCGRPKHEHQLIEDEPA